MSLLDRFRPPPGAPGAVRHGAACCRGTAAGLDDLADRTRNRWGVLGSTWHGPARSAFGEVAEPFLTAIPAASGALRELADGLDRLADGIEAAQTEYHHRMLAVGLTAAAGIVLTPLTLTASDEAAGAAVAVELAAATQIATSAAETVLAVLAGVAEQAVALAARWAVLAGIAVGADVAAGAMVRGPGEALRHLDLAGDAEVALVGAVAVPIGAEFAAALRGAGSAAFEASGAGRAAVRLAVGAASFATADVVVKAALRQGIDPGEIAMMALPLGPLGRSGAVRGMPLGFADEAAFSAFAKDLHAGLRDAGYGDAVAVFQGSAVTGVKYTTGAPFDVGRRSDFDIALTSPSLFAKAKELGIEIRMNPLRTAPLQVSQLERLGLRDLAARLATGAERKVHFMIYPDLTAAIDRAGGIRLR